jgi:dihydrodipicolinate synthase/N-acetylneuraminate lyase
MTETLRGILPIVVTPFTHNYDLDEGSLRKQVHFCIRAGAKALVGPANASEFATLSDDERKRWIEIVIAEAGGQIPVFASVTAVHKIPAVELALHAQRIGAYGVMSMPPHINHPDESGCYDYYQALSEALAIPIIIQNYIGPVGTPMSPGLMARMCRELEHVAYIKEETLPSSRKISATIAAAGSLCKGIYGGQGGIYLLDDFNRGAAGNMPASQATDVLANIWALLESGREEEARSLFNRLLPLINYERQYGVALYKEVLKRRGVFVSTQSRAPGNFLEKEDLAELDAILKTVEPLFTC